MDKLTFAADVISSLAWPVAIVLILCTFRKPLTDLIKELAKTLGRGPVEIGKEGIKFGGRSPESQSEASGDGGDVTEKTLKTPELAPIDHYPKAIREAMTNLQNRMGPELEAAAAEQGLSHEQLLIRGFADQFLSLQLERIYRLLLGSQLRALAFIQGQSNFRTNKTAVQVFYDGAAAAYPDEYASYSFERWLNWLVGAGLVLLEGDDIELTDVALALPSYLEVRGYGTDLTY